MTLEEQFCVELKPLFFSLRVNQIGVALLCLSLVASTAQRIAGKRAGGRAGSKQQPARCSRKTQDKFAIASMAKKLLHS